MTINEKLQNLLRLYNKAAVSREAGISKMTLLRYVNSAQIPSFPITKKLAAALGVDFVWLVDDRQEWPPVRVETSELEPAAAA